MVGVALSACGSGVLPPVPAPKFDAAAAVKIGAPPSTPAEAEGTGGGGDGDTAEVVAEAACG